MTDQVLLFLVLLTQQAGQLGALLLAWWGNGDPLGSWDSIPKGKTVWWQPGQDSRVCGMIFFITCVTSEPQPASLLPDLAPCVGVTLAEKTDAQGAMSRAVKQAPWRMGLTECDC